MKWQRRGDFSSDFQAMQNQHGYFHECKWNKAHNPDTESMFNSLVEYFFKHKWLAFHCFIIEKSVIRKEFHKGGLDEARRKYLCKLLTNKMARVAKKFPARNHTFRVWIDPLPSRYSKADEVLQIISNHILKKYGEEPYRLVGVHQKDSSITPTIQLCDLLLGAVVDARNKRAVSPLKKKLQRRISEHLDWPDLNADTMPGERKFNVWEFYDPTKGPRKAETRKVNLLYSLN